MQTSTIKSSYHMLASTGSLSLCLRQQTDINWFAGVENRPPGESPF